MVRAAAGGASGAMVDSRRSYPECERSGRSSRISADAWRYRRRVLVLEAISGARRAMRHRGGAVRFDGQTELLLGFAVLAGLHIGKADIDHGLRVGRIDLQNLAELLDR